MSGVSLAPVASLVLVSLFKGYKLFGKASLMANRQFGLFWANPLGK